MTADDHPKQFRLQIVEQVKGRPPFLISDRQLDDPFIHTTIVLGQGFWQRLGVAMYALRGLEFRLHLSGTEKAVYNVMNADYTPFPPREKNQREGASQQTHAN